MDKSGRNSSERGENSCGGAMLHVPLGLKQMTLGLGNEQQVALPAKSRAIIVLLRNHG